MAELKACSAEQLEVIKSIRTNNVAVDAVAGSGKTTTCLHICREYRDKKILLLTYNSRLKLETKERFEKHSINNAEIYSYHSFVKKYYNPEGYTDSVIDKIITKNTKPILNFSYQIIIIDEIQDISPLYYQLICKLYTDNIKTSTPYVVIFGDKNQCIYDFKKADERYLILSASVFSYCNRGWIDRPMTCSFRITKQMANFINVCMLKNTRLNAVKKGVKPLYIKCNVYDGHSFHYCKPYDETKSVILTHLKKYIDLGYTADDILIISPSVKSEYSPARVIANFITKYITDCKTNHPKYEIYKKYPIYVSTSDDSSPSDKVVKGKILICTYHQSKGLERRVVFVMSFDNSYYKYNAPKADPSYCPNIFYVATTRALEHLILVHHNEKDYLPFLDKNNLYKYCDMVGELNIKDKDKDKNEVTPSITVTKLISHLPHDIVDLCYNKLIKIDKYINNKPLKIQNQIKQPYGYEEVSEITGIAIPAYLQFKTQGICCIYDKPFQNKKISNQKNITIDIVETDENESCFNNDDFTDLTNFITPSDDSLSDVDDLTDNKTELIDETFYDCFKTKETFYAMLNSNDSLKTNKLLYCATRYCSESSGYIFKNIQIKNHTWLTEANLNKSYLRCESLKISKCAKFEEDICSIVEINKYDMIRKKTIIGKIDCVDDKSIYEFKCVKEIKKEHFLQLAIYMYMHKKDLIKKYRDQHDVDEVPIDELNKYHYYLFNILTDDLYEILCSMNELHNIIIILINEKHKNLNKVSNEEFVYENSQIIKKYINA